MKSMLTRFKVAFALMALLAIAVVGSTAQAAEVNNITPEFYIGVCSSSAELIFKNGAPGGKGRTKVTCPSYPRGRKVEIEVKVKAKALNSSATWVEVASDKKECTLALYPLKCELDVPFTALSDKTKLYKVFGVAKVNGSNGVPAPVKAGVGEWVFNHNGQPYPKDRYMNRAPVPFPTYVGPWTGGDPRDQDKFIKACNDYYQKNNWLLPLPGTKVQYHHIHPLGNGGKNVASNCYILSVDIHKKYTAWWEGFRP